MTIRNALGKHLLDCLFLGILLTVLGCEGTESREEVDTTVEELAGQKDLERYNQMKEDLDEIKSRQAEKMQSLHDDSEKQ